MQHVRKCNQLVGRPVFPCQLHVKSLTSQSHFDLLLQLPLEATPDYLTLTRLQTVRDGRDRQNIVGHGEKNEFLINEIRVRDLVDVMIQICAGL